ncbi:hypothetical protein HCR08_04015 [Wolbachia pipientis]|uniref:hypothetical protein n=1 Tax=Wolbachia pipientis TaxID=955 RepID=UPI0015FC476C|nr:hypothetical protein [Wolbachia pipientis]MBA8755204.1 hypothetical protein [Wolbachia pipientis]
MLLLYHSHKHISYPIRTIARSAIVAIKSSLISLVKRLKHKKRQYFKADNNPRASFAFFFIW